MNIVKIPLVNGLNKTKGTNEAPEKIIEGLGEIYSNEIGKEILVDKLKISEVKIDDDLIKTNDLIYKEAFNDFSKNNKTLFLGGDHSVSYPLTRSFFDYSENKGVEPAVIVFDAHPDLMEPVDNKIPTHEEWLKALINDGFNPKNILLIGARNCDPSELKVINDLGIKRFSVNQLMANIEGVTDAIMEFGYKKSVYVSIDIDIVDPAFAPGVGYLEPAGITSRQLIYIIQRLSLMKNLRAVDIVEVNPTKDINGMTSKLAAKVVSELI